MSTPLSDDRAQYTWEPFHLNNGSLKIKGPLRLYSVSLYSTYSAQVLIDGVPLKIIGCFESSWRGWDVEKLLEVAGTGHGALCYVLDTAPALCRVARRFFARPENTYT